MSKQHRSANAQAPVASPARPQMPRGPGRLGTTRADRARDQRLINAMWANAAGRSDDGDDDARYRFQLQGIDREDEASYDD